MDDRDTDFSMLFFCNFYIHFQLTVNFFNNNPFVKILGFWILGLLSAKYACELAVLPFYWLIVGGVWLVTLLPTKKHPQKQLKNSLLACSVFLLSAINYQWQHPPIPETPSTTISIVATIKEKPLEKANSFQALLRIEQSEEPTLRQHSVVCWFPKLDELRNTEAGSQLYLHAPIKRIENKGIPFEFDYQTYMAAQGIYYQTFVTKNSFRLLDSRQSSIFTMAETWRNRLLAILRSHLHQAESFQVVSALSLGYRNELTPETKAYFMRTGAMHVLAVSGLHVGLILLFLQTGLKFMGNKTTARWIRFSIILVSLWAYALITGLSPSVLRACTMFSFLHTAQQLQRNSSIYNTLAASAFVLLFVQPDLLFAVGFQLSYAAVASIVYFYPLLEPIVPSRSKWIRKLWQLLCVSAAAQIGTFPLSIYYFHQFPTYFWLSNFVAIPAAFLILSGSFLILITAPFPFLSKTLGSLLDSLTSLVLDLLKMIGNLPGAVISQISISPLQLGLLIILILTVIFFIEYAQKRHLYWALSCLIGFQLIGLGSKLKLFNQHLLIQYGDKKPVYHFINGRENYLLAADSSTVSPYLFKNTLTALQLNQPTILYWIPNQSFQTRDLRIEGHLCQFGQDLFVIKEKGRSVFKLAPLSVNDSISTNDQLTAFQKSAIKQNRFSPPSSSNSQTND